MGKGGVVLGEVSRDGDGWVFWEGYVLGGQGGCRGKGCVG